MALILSLETSTTVCSVALHRDGVLVSSAETFVPQSAATQLAPLIEEARKKAGVDMKAVEAVAITSGPGSYTGLRIGTSTAKGLCYALKIPLIAIDTLTLLASQVRDRNSTRALLCPMLDARRMEVYCRIYDADIKALTAIEAKVIDGESFSEFLTAHDVIFFGDGAAKCKGTITHLKAQFMDDVHPLALHLGVLAQQRFDVGAFEDLVHFEPYYLKEFVAKQAASPF